jgi:hypothetical protein
LGRLIFYLAALEAQPRRCSGTFLTARDKTKGGEERNIHNSVSFAWLPLRSTDLMILLVDSTSHACADKTEKNPTHVRALLLPHPRFVPAASTSIVSNAHP